jgi:hypothetical protein
MLGADLTSLTRKRFPSSTAFSPKEILSCVVGVKSSGIRGAEPGERLAWEREEERDWAWAWRAIVAFIS